MKTFSVFDIIGPRMVGPSSSHTAGAVRIGNVVNRLAGGRIVSADITLYGSFADTGRGHGTDRAIIAGLLGIPPDDSRVRYAMLLAKGEEVEISVRYSAEETNHPNTAKVDVKTPEGKKISVVGVSTGGGNIEIVEIDGMEVSFTGNYPTIIAYYTDMPGIISRVTAVLAKSNVNVAFMKVFRSAKRKRACMVIEVDTMPAKELLDEIRERVSEIEEVSAI